MDIKNFSIPLTNEERAALYEQSTRECRRPADQLRWIVLQALAPATANVQPTVNHSQPTENAK